MKNIFLLSESGAIHDYIRQSWQSDFFREAHVPGSFLDKTTGRFARLPRFFYDMSDVELEQAHFSPWWGGVARRSYDNPVMHDLYMLHELVHGMNMVYIAGQNKDSFVRKMSDNELYASTLSEVISYFAMPGLRDIVPFSSIFADRFLTDAYWQRAWKEDPERMVDDIFYRRRQSMLFPRKDDAMEGWLNGFVNQNHQWYEIWSSRFDTVETQMERFTRSLPVTGRSDALRRHIDWLMSDDIAYGGDIPFPQEARGFADVYWVSRPRPSAALEAA